MAKKTMFGGMIARWQTPLGLLGLVILAAFMRFWKFTELPPGLATTEARLGLTVQAFIHHGMLPGYTLADGYSPLLVLLQALPVQALGATTWSLRIVPALIGISAVLAVWLWARSWFGIRVAWVAAFLLAVTPWAVTIARSGSAASLMPLLVPLTFWLVTTSYRRGRVWTWVASGMVLGLDLLAGPLGWGTVGLVILACLTWVAMRRRMPQWTSGRAVAFVIAIILAALAGYLAGRLPSGVTTLPAQLGLPAGASQLIAAVGAGLLMFNIRGDAHFQHNLGGEPLFNVFIGLMFITGILVSMSRINGNRYRRLLVAFVAFMVPVFLSVNSAPDSYRAAAVLPVAMIMAAIGVSYLLGIWNSTFPINSAARASGLTAVVFLLGLSFFQGYTQYFHAWAGSAETYAAYNADVVGAARYANDLKPEPGTKHYVVAASDETPVALFLLKPGTMVVSPDAFKILPITTGTYEFMITLAARDAVKGVLVDKYPGANLVPHFSAFNDSDSYYVYKVTK